MAPFVGRLIDQLVPWYASVMATVTLLFVQAIYVGAAGVNVAAVVIVTVGLDVSRQMQQVSLTSSVYSISEKKRARLNAVLILSLFIGQIMGTAVGTKVFIAHGWRAGGFLMFAFTVWQLIVILLRGPHVRRQTWFGYEGGLRFRKDAANAEHERTAQSGGDSGQETAETTDIEKATVQGDDVPENSDRNDIKGSTSEKQNTEMVNSDAVSKV